MGAFVSAKAEYRVTLNLTEAQYQAMRNDMAVRDYTSEQDYLLDLLKDHLPYYFPDDAVGRGGKREGAGRPRKQVTDLDE